MEATAADSHRYHGLEASPRASVTDSYRTDPIPLGCEIGIRKIKGDLMSYHFTSLLVQCLIIVFIPCIVVFPVIRYMKAGQKIKQLEILDGQSPLAAGYYFRMFCKATDVSDTPIKNAEKLKSEYERWYGEHWFNWPLVIVSVVATIGAYVEVTALAALLCDAVTCSARIPLVFALPIPAMTALAGAFIWVTNDFITRARRLDFSPSDVHWGTLRIAGSIPLGYAFVYFYASIPPRAEPERMTAAAFIAFAIAAFPLSETHRMLRRLFLCQSRFSEFLSLRSETDEVMKFQGVNNDISTRLAKEDITTITQIAYCDPIRISMRSGLSFNFITDCMSQALAWEYLEEGLNVIRPLGFRGAVELSKLYSHLLESSDPKLRTCGKSILRSVCKALNAYDGTEEGARAKGKTLHTVQTLRFLLRELAGDPFTIYLVSISGRADCGALVC
jgi:hypothetical protein